MWLGRSRNRSRQEKAQLQKQVKQGEYGACLFLGVEWGQELSAEQQRD